ncbi:hypothetical protein LTR53_000841 [Teratosphaeriaceae sp. CCFEE 6253]|nr:hypothetical protein LTR53_000841 [Teratosphaeriaceae sp. CCFEE 6253]
MVPLLLTRWTPLVDSPYCHEDGAPEILGITGAFLGAALVCVALRVYVRIWMLKFFGADDYVMVAAAVMGIGVFVTMVGETKWGIGRHNVCVRPDDQIGQVLEEVQWKWEFPHALCIVLGVILVKISIALFLMRMAPKRSWRRFLWAAVVFLTCFAIACLGTLIFACVPVQAQWTPALRADPATKCFSNSTYSFIGLFNAVVNICTDVLFAVLPIPIIVKLQDLEGSLIAPASGSSPCAAGIIKANLQTKFIMAPDGYFKDSFNVWNMLELCLGIIAGSLPSLKPLFANLLASTKTALCFSEGSRKASRPPAAYPTFSGHSAGSNGYKRQHDAIHLDDLPQHDRSATTRESPAAEPHAYADEKTGPYNVRITSAPLPRPRGGSMDEEAADFGRSDSQEVLHRPPGIYRTLEVTRTSEMMRR